MDSTDTYGNWFCTSSYAVCLSEHEIYSNMMQSRDLSLDLNIPEQKTKNTPPKPTTSQTQKKRESRII